MSKEPKHKRAVPGVSTHDHINGFDIYYCIPLQTYNITVGSKPIAQRVTKEVMLAIVDFSYNI